MALILSALALALSAYGLVSLRWQVRQEIAAEATRREERARRAAALLKDGPTENPIVNAVLRREAAAGRYPTTPQGNGGSDA